MPKTEGNEIHLGPDASNRSKTGSSNLRIWSGKEQAAVDIFRFDSKGKILRALGCAATGPKTICECKYDALIGEFRPIASSSSFVGWIKAKQLLNTIFSDGSQKTKTKEICCKNRLRTYILSITEILTAASTATNIPPYIDQ